MRVKSLPSAMHLRYGYYPTEFNVTDRVDQIAFSVSVEMADLPDDVRNALDVTGWAKYVKKVVRAEFPGMHALCANDRYMSVLVELCKKHQKVTYEWVDRNYMIRLKEFRPRMLSDVSGLIEKHQATAYDRIVRSVWKRGFDGDYDRAVRFVEYVSKTWFAWDRTNSAAWDEIS